jgi:UDP-N-acetyl-2-amino-2-deoxyglucuronate dehydrogenase
MSDKVGFAIIGSGMISQFHADAMRQVPNAEFRAVFDMSAPRAKAFADTNGCRVAASLQELAEDPTIQAVCVTTPSGAHADCAIPILEAGKAVLCEKPLEVTVEKVDAILAAEKRGGGKLASVFQSRFGKGAKLMKQAVESGRFGRLTLCSAYIKWWRDLSYYSTSNWKGTWKMDGGGALMNQGVHAVDLLQWFVGLPEQVSAFYATLAHPGVEAEDTLAATLKFPHGALGVIEAATSAWPGEDLRIEICGDKGSAILVQDRITRWQFAKPLPEDEAILRNEGTGGIGGGASDPKAITTEGHRLLIADLVEAIQQNRPPMIPGSEARRAISLIRAIYESGRDGRAVTLK